MIDLRTIYVEIYGQVSKCRVLGDRLTIYLHKHFSTRAAKAARHV